MSNRSIRRKSVYERIEDAQNKITAKEQELAQLNMVLRNLEAERDDLEMHQLFELVKKNNINFEKAKSMLVK